MHQGDGLPNMLEELKGDDPKMCGYSYYHVIYVAAATLAVIMTYMYFIVEDIQVKNMVITQGLFSIGLLLSSMYFRKRLQESKQERALQKIRQEEAASRNTKRKRR